MRLFIFMLSSSLFKSSFFAEIAECSVEVRCLVRNFMFIMNRFAIDKNLIPSMECIIYSLQSEVKLEGREWGHDY